MENIPTATLLHKVCPCLWATSLPRLYLCVCASGGNSMDLVSFSPAPLYSSLCLLLSPGSSVSRSVVYSILPVFF